MIGRLAVVALALGLASCAGIEPAGRTARSSGPAPAATPRTTPALPPPAQTSPAPPAAAQTLPPTPPAQAPTAAATQRSTPPQTAAPQIAAPPPSAPAPPARAQASEDDEDDIVVSGQVQAQVPPPAGDPRTNEERRADVRAWDQCVTQVQGAFDADPMRPQLTTPEEYCAQSLGMADRASVPISRRQR